MVTGIERENLKDVIRQVVLETVQAISADPDFGLELQAWVKDQLKGDPGEMVLFDEIKEDYIS